MSFEEKVIRQSNSKPVVVDFWAPWCGPCRVLGPVIEALALEDDRWDLVKINTEEEQEIAMRYGIRSIPNVKMFSKGKIISEFAGALPKHQIQKWLDENLPSREKADWQYLTEEFGNLELAGQIELLRQFLLSYPDHLEAKLNLSKMIALSHPEEALTLINQLKPGQPDYDLRSDIEVLNELWSADYDVSNPSEILLRQASEAAKRNDYESTIKLLIDAVTVDKSVINELPRRASIAIFHILGPRNPLTTKYRRLFDMALY